MFEIQLLNNIKSESLPHDEKPVLHGNQPKPKSGNLESMVFDKDVQYS